MSFFWRKFLVRTGIAKMLPSVKRLLAGTESYLRYFSDRTLAVPLEELLDPSFFPDVQGPDSINLALGAPRCELSLGALRGVQDRRAMSAWGLPELRDAIATTRKTEQGPSLGEPEEILITHGATGAFAAAIDTFLNPGDAVVLFDPGSPIFPIGLKHRRAKIRWVPTQLEEGVVRFRIDDFRKAMRGARMLVYADPVNPTGGIFSPEDQEQIAFWAKKNDTFIFRDESFEAFRPEPPRTRMTALPHSANRLLSAGSFSKQYGLASARVGWLAGNPHLLRACTATSAMNVPFVPPLCQQVALTAIRTGEATVASIRDEFAGRRRYVYERLQGMGLRPMWPAAGYFFWVSTSEWRMSGKEFSRRLVEAKRVLVNPGEPFGPSGKDFFRLSYASEEGRLREGLARLAEFMQECSRPATSATQTTEPTESNRTPDEAATATAS